ncbi:MAG: helix-turn-helix transcriptional regulator [bacterium]|nr:helix-turn-helix transcriptional regulator [bacterium]MCY3889551.1 helix-turn-helix transcriptional regulator [bacterium]
METLAERDNGLLCDMSSRRQAMGTADKPKMVLPNLATPLYGGGMAGRRIAGMLRNAREAKGQSLRSAAKDLGVDASYLSRVETGERQPSAELRDRAVSHYALDGEHVALAAGDIPSDIAEILLQHPELLVEIRARYGQLR